MMKGARRLVEVVVDIKKGENVVIITDTNKMDIAEVIAAAAYERDAEVITTIMTPRSYHSENIPKAVVAAMNSADVIFAPTTVSATTWLGRKANPETHARAASLAGWYPRQLVKGGLFADFDKLKPEVDRITKLYDDTKIAHLTSHMGTDITIALKTGAHPQYSIVRDPGTSCSIPIVGPAGPVDIGSPQTEGKIVIDGSLCLDEFSPLREPITLIVKKGRIKEIQGGLYSRKFEKYLEDLNDPTVYNLVELAFGMNPEAECWGSFAEDQAAGDTHHIGIGGRGQLGSTGAHLDLVFLNATCEMDNQLVQKDGKFVI